LQKVTYPRWHGELASAAASVTSTRPVCTSTPTPKSRNEIGTTAEGHNARDWLVSSPKVSKDPHCRLWPPQPAKFHSGQPGESRRPPMTTRCFALRLMRSMPLSGENWSGVERSKSKILVNRPMDAITTVLSAAAASVRRYTSTALRVSAALRMGDGYCNTRSWTYQPRPRFVHAAAPSKPSKV